MSDFSYGAVSRKNLFTCNEGLIQIGTAAINASPYDFSIIEGHRNLKRQQKLYESRDKQGNRLTFIDGITQKGKHNYTPSKAFDFQPYPTIIDGVSCWDQEGQWRFYVIAGVILAQAKILDIRIRWGGDWDGDGSQRDQTLHDLPHIETY